MRFRAVGNVYELKGTDRNAEKFVQSGEYDSVLGKTNAFELLVYDNAQVPEKLPKHVVVEERHDVCKM